MPDSLRLAAWPSTGPAWFVSEPDAAAWESGGDAACEGTAGDGAAGSRAGSPEDSAESLQILILRPMDTQRAE